MFTLAGNVVQDSPVAVNFTQHARVTAGASPRRRAIFARAAVLIHNTAVSTILSCKTTLATVSTSPRSLAVTRARIRVELAKPRARREWAFVTVLAFETVRTMGADADLLVSAVNCFANCHDISSIALLRSECTLIALIAFPILIAAFACTAYRVVNAASAVLRLQITGQAAITSPCTFALA
jgi:hypothetical protein